MLYESCTYRDDCDSCGWALWQMTETEDQLRTLCPPDCPPCTFTHTVRRQEYYAVRALLASMLGGDKVIAYHSSGRPYLTDHSYHISISHTHGFCALAWHATQPVGIDIEQIADRVARVAHRFVNIAEQAQVEALFPHDIVSGQLLLWSAKEAAYKCIDRQGVDFLHDIVVNLGRPHTSQPGTVATQGTCTVDCRVFSAEGDDAFVPHPMHYRFYPTFVCVIVGDFNHLPI